MAKSWYLEFTRSTQLCHVLSFQDASAALSPSRKTTQLMFKSSTPTQVFWAFASQLGTSISSQMVVMSRSVVKAWAITRVTMLALISSSKKASETREHFKPLDATRWTTSKQIAATQSPNTWDLVRTSMREENFTWELKQTSLKRLWVLKGQKIKTLRFSVSMDCWRVSSRWKMEIHRKSELWKLWKQNEKYLQRIWIASSRRNKWETKENKIDNERKLHLQLHKKLISRNR